MPAAAKRTARTARGRNCRVIVWTIDGKRTLLL